MDIQKINKWIGNILWEDGEKLSYGSIRTLNDIKKEINKTGNSATQRKAPANSTTKICPCCNGQGTLIVTTN